MKIIISPHAGFCFGVQRAISIALEAVREHGKVYCVGPLIHNTQAVEDLRRQGLDTVESQQEVPRKAPVLVRTHGAGPELYEAARRLQHLLIDATCPFVTRAHEAARQFQQEGYQVLVLGDRQHPEAQGIVQHTGGHALIVEQPGEIEGLDLAPRVAIVCQTTQRRENLQALVAAVLPRVRELRVANTICDATTQRQEASQHLARQVDVMVVVGGYHSANTTRLAQICQATGTPTHHVEVAEELDPKWFEGAQTVGVSAGASTPDDIIEAVVNRLAEIGGEGSEIIWPDRDEKRRDKDSREG
ncbi:MAG: 4-hydroxy-3-methylbut-2-enyl diphosphate reductase [Armatimonadetes bacterium]|nr:4-hydroxy-3-methylbut-2-enyl diphosphate reductase [Armatimonadota bacterium]